MEEDDCRRKARTNLKKGPDRAEKMPTGKKLLIVFFHEILALKTRDFRFQGCQMVCFHPQKNLFG
jgi:hypothetical protein